MTKRLFLGLTFFATVLLYFPIFRTFFTGDDFFHFSVSRIDSFTDIVRFFAFYPIEVRGYAFYRPLFRELLYGVYYSLFGLNHVPFRLLSLFLHIVNISLVYKLARRLFNSSFVANFAAFFFAITAANVGVLYYLAGGIQALGATLFTLLSLLAFLDRNKLRTFLFFVLGLMSHEQAAVIPFLVLLLGLIQVKNLTRSNIDKRVVRFVKDYWYFFATLGAYGYLNFFVIGVSGGEVQYQPNFNIATLANTFGWYVGWAFGLPEMLVDFVRPGFSLNPNLLKYWNTYFQFIFPAFFVTSAILAGIGAWLILKKRQVFQNKRFWFLIVWFPLALLPVLFLPLHKKTYYLAPALPAFWMGVGYLVDGFTNASKPRKAISQSVAAVLTLALLLLSSVSVKLAEKTYWAINRSKVADRVLSDLKSEYRELPKGASLYIKNDPEYPFISESWGGTSTQTNLALSGPDAIRLLYNDFSIDVFYEDLHERPLGDIFEFVVVID